MENIFRSKEVYKKINTDDGDKLVSVRNLYVSGNKKIDPLYIDGILSINSLSTNKTTVERLTDANVVIENESTSSMSQIDISPLKSVHFRVQQKELENESTTSLSNLTISDMTYLKLKGGR